MKTALRLLLAPPIDSDVIGWKSRVIAAGGTVSSGTVLALSRFSKACKAAGLWDKLNRVNLFCGDQLAAALIPLKVGSGSATDTNVNFVSGDYTEATGITGNGSSKYLNTGVAQNALTAASRHLSVYARVRGTNTFRGVIGSRTGASTNQWAISTLNPVSTAGYQSSSTATGASFSPVPAGFIVGSGTDTSSVLYSAGSSVNTTAVAAATPSANALFVFAVNVDGTAASYSNDTLAGYSIGTGLTASEVSAYNTIMEQFQDALGRGVQ